MWNEMDLDKDGLVQMSDLKRCGQLAPIGQAGHQRRTAAGRGGVPRI